MLVGAGFDGEDRVQCHEFEEVADTIGRAGEDESLAALVCFEAEYAGGEFASPFYRAGLWLPPRELSQYPVSAPQRRLARQLMLPDRQRRLF